MSSSWLKSTTPYYIQADHVAILFSQCDHYVLMHSALCIHTNMRIWQLLTKKALRILVEFVEKNARYLLLLLYFSLLLYLTDLNFLLNIWLGRRPTPLYIYSQRHVHATLVMKSCPMSHKLQRSYFFQFMKIKWKYMDTNRNVRLKNKINVQFFCSVPVTVFWFKTKVFVFGFRFC